MTAILQVEDLHVAYGETKVLHGVGFAVETRGITTILGANGAGKTTTLRAVSGIVPPRGRIELDGRRIDGKACEDIARLGIAHVPEGRGTFAELSVKENLRLGAYTQRTAAFKADYARVLNLFPWMQRREGQQAGTLSGGEQQMLALGRALMQRPRLLLLDEPSLGLAPSVVAEIFRIVRELNEKEGLSVLVVEQNAAIALDAAARAYVLEVGRVVVTGTSEELRRDESVRRSYLGY